MSAGKSGIPRLRPAIWVLSMVAAAALLLEGAMSATAFGQQRYGPPPGVGGPPPWLTGPGGPGNPYGGGGPRRPAKAKKAPVRKAAPQRPAGTPLETEYPFRVLMKDGRRIYGQVKDDADGYMVTKKAGSVRVLKTEVERIEDTATGATTKPAPPPAPKPLGRPAVKTVAGAAAAKK